MEQKETEREEHAEEEEKEKREVDGNSGAEVTRLIKKEKADNERRKGRCRKWRKRKRRGTMVT